MSSQDPEFWKRQYERQKIARQEAELLLENKSLELFKANQALKELNESLQQQLQAVREKDEAREAAEQSANAKTMFLATMSHEIRTPLNGIISMNRLLIESELNTEQRNFAETVQASANSLLRIINDILDISKVESGELELEEEEFAILDKLESTFEINQLKAESKGLQFIVNYDPQLPELLIGDSTRLRQVIVNLVANAIKFTSEGTVQVQIRVVDQTTDQFTLNFSVSDTGIGMDEATLNKVFEPFKQGDSSINRRFGGTGLGLSICKGIIEKMGGKLHCESRANEGTTIDFTLPFAVSQKNMPKRFGNHCGTTLVTAADPMRRSALVNLLKHQGLNPLPVDDPTQYFIDSREHKSCGQCLWFIDIFNFADSDHETLKSHLAYKPDHIVPLIIESPNKSIPEGQLRYFEYSKIAFPNTRRELTDKVCRVCNVACDSNPNKTGTPRINLPTPANYRILIAEDNEINQIAARITLEKFGFQVLIANDGKEVLDFMDNEDELDLILMDINMPVMDGLEACRIIRTKGSKIPIVALTANAMKGDREKFIEYGMNDYLSKPLDVFLLRNVLEQHLGGQNESKDSEHKTVSRPPDSPREMLDRDVLSRKLGNDDQLINTLLGKFDFELHRNAKAAFEYLEQNNLKQAISCFHLISGSAATLEITELKTITKTIEMSLKEDGQSSQISSDLKSFKQSIEHWENWYAQATQHDSVDGHE